MSDSKSESRSANEEEEDKIGEEKEEETGREERAARACMLGRYVHVEIYKSRSSNCRSSTSSTSRMSTRSTLQSTAAPLSSRWKDVFRTRFQSETSLLSSFKQAVRPWRAMRERDDEATWQVTRGSKRVARLSAAVVKHSMELLCRVVGCAAVITPDNLIGHAAWHRDMARAGGEEGGGGGGAGCKGAGNPQGKAGGGLEK